MSQFDLEAELPEFAAEQGAANEAELAEALAELAALSMSDLTASEVTAGRARLLGAVQAGPERYAPFFGKLTKFFDLSMDALREIFARAEKESEWQPGPLPWVSLFHLQGGPAVAGFDTGFVRMKRGTPFPPHRHTAFERVLILSGSYHDSEGQYFGPGDLHVMAEGTEHALQMSADEDVFFAVVLAGEIQVLGAP
ncbi:MAG TPA: cupin domain-containing protein [Polyangiaceae bacterium]|jgi:quercetin dioxygenase-like cupin family protein|nr:cupin domain-containing protein [Polyangiaceae bacterium]